MWLLIKEIRVGKYRHKLFRNRSDVEKYLIGEGAKQESQYEFLAIQTSYDGPWKQQQYIRYHLEYLIVN